MGLSVCVVFSVCTQGDEFVVNPGTGSGRRSSSFDEESRDHYSSIRVSLDMFVYEYLIEFLSASQFLC